MRSITTPSSEIDCRRETAVWFQAVLTQIVTVDKSSLRIRIYGGPTLQ